LEMCSGLLVGKNLMSYQSLYSNAVLEWADRVNILAGIGWKTPDEN
jgi:hypothetical protein